MGLKQLGKAARVVQRVVHGVEQQQRCCSSPLFLNDVGTLILASPGLHAQVASYKWWVVRATTRPLCATHAHLLQDTAPTSTRSIGFCVIWVCISSSSRPIKHAPYLTSYPKNILKLVIWRACTRTNEATELTVLSQNSAHKNTSFFLCVAYSAPKEHGLVAQSWYPRRWSCLKRVHPVGAVYSSRLVLCVCVLENCVFLGTGTDQKIAARDVLNRRVLPARLFRARQAK
jgi:hypothetical protein